MASFDDVGDPAPRGSISFGLPENVVTSHEEPLVYDKNGTEKSAVVRDEFFSLKDWVAKMIPVFPLIAWMPSHNKHWKSIMWGDLIGGLTVGALLIPQGIAYANVAKVLPVFGLYSGFIPCLVYSFWGTSGQLSVGPIATISLITAQAASKVFPDADCGMDPNSVDCQNYLDLVVLMCFQMGLILLVFGLIGLGFISNFLSHPVIEGYKTGVCFSVGVGQLKLLINRPVDGTDFFPTLGNFFKELPHADLLSIAYAVGTVAIILGQKYYGRSKLPGAKIVKYIPGVLVAVILGIILSVTAHSDRIAVVGNIPSGLVAPRAPNFAHFFEVLPEAFVLAIIGYAESVSIATAFAQKHGEVIEPTREFYGVGLANILGSFFLSFPVSGTPSRTVISDLAGARTVGNNIPQGLVVMFGLLFLTPLFEKLPNPVLGAIVILALSGLVQPTRWWHIYKVKPLDFLVPWVTFLGILWLGIADGIGIGVAFSLFLLILYSSFPGFAILGKRGSDFVPIYQYDDDKGINGIAVFRFAADLHFANAGILQSRVNEIVERRRGTLNEVHTIVIDASGMHFVDCTGATEMCVLKKTLGYVSEEHPDRKPVQLLVAECNHSVSRTLQKAGFLSISQNSDNRGPASYFYERVEDAVKSAHEDKNTI